MPKDSIFRLTCYWLAHSQLGVQHDLYKKIAAALERLELGHAAA